MNELREFDKRSKYFLISSLVIIFLILITSSHDNVYPASRGYIFASSYRKNVASARRVDNV